MVDEFHQYLSSSRTMLFNSLTFVVFFAVVLLVDRLPLRWSLRKLNLLVASYLFYAAWNPPFVLLLLVSAVVDYGLELAIGSPRPTKYRVVCSSSARFGSPESGLQSYLKYGPYLLVNYRG